MQTVAMSMQEYATRESEDLDDAAKKRTASPVLSQPSPPRSTRWRTTTGSLTVDRPQPRDPARSAVNGVADGSCHGARCIPLQHTSSTNDRQDFVTGPGRHPYPVNQHQVPIGPHSLMPAPGDDRPQPLGTYHMLVQRRVMSRQLPSLTVSQMVIWSGSRRVTANRPTSSGNDPYSGRPSKCRSTTVHVPVDCAGPTPGIPYPVSHYSPPEVRTTSCDPAVLGVNATSTVAHPVGCERMFSSKIPPTRTRFPTPPPLMVLPSRTSNTMLSTRFCLPGAASRELLSVQAH
ncbi:hypothetical protein BXZ70DRAFT_907526 [Cristinia sonorae]|uniref:Uncharacterized protein n=1 Tax=Cristinia sonorae TaxID=1940300 RepID=A0A8K0XPX1_9AGAR|nr:hypothetical protein BXZ70DRAFT_907526 [Cristinia sonorae]